MTSLCLGNVGKGCHHWWVGFGWNPYYLNQIQDPKLGLRPIHDQDKVQGSIVPVDDLWIIPFRDSFQEVANFLRALDNWTEYLAMAVH